MILVLCFHFVKRTPFARKKQAKLPPCCDPIAIRSGTRKMSTSGTSSYKETAQEVALLKEQMVEMMRMMQQLVIGGGLNSFGHSQEGPQTENENLPSPVQE